MNYLLDTNVVSEWIKPVPDRNVVAWLANADEDRIFLSVASVAEICRGVERLPHGRKRERLATWLADDLLARFEHRVLDIDATLAQVWGLLMARAEHIGIGLGSLDAFLAATALSRELTLVTRNVGGFERLGIALLNPWEPLP
jgi:toxin FitB